MTNIHAEDVLHFLQAWRMLPNLKTRNVILAAEISIAIMVEVATLNDSRIRLAVGCGVGGNGGAGWYREITQ